jgi:hypothetical protein
MHGVIRNFILFVFVLLSQTSCIEPISFPVASTNGKIVIYGRITNDDEPQYVYIQRSYIDNQEAEPVRNATVILHDGSGNIYPFKQEKPGKYRLQNLTKGTPGESYYIEIFIADKTYRSAVEKMPEKVGIDSLYYSISTESFLSRDGTRNLHRLYVYAKSTLPKTDNYHLRWVTDESYFMPLTFFPNAFNTPPPDCYASDRVDTERINLLAGTNSNQRSVEQLLAEREIDYTFKSRHYIIVSQMSTTKESYDYWNTIKSLVKNTGSPFDIPPAPIRGNIKNSRDENELVLGYFEACNVSISTFFLIPGFIPYWLQPYCEYDRSKPNFTDYPAVCLRCENLPNYSYVKTRWFP